MTLSNRQKNHYEAIHDAYREYYDRASMAYRRRFIYEPLFAELNLDGKDVADLACGSGATSRIIRELYPAARLTGFDISGTACGEYRRNLGRPAHELDLTHALPKEVPTFDAAVVIGGLHHCVADLPATFANLKRLLRPGGILLMMEPSADFLLNGCRRLWYRQDRYFDARTERALSHAEIAGLAAPEFRPLHLEYLGGPGYFLILNSMIFRLPPRLKGILAKPLTGFDALYNKLPGRVMFPYFLARWQRTENKARAS